MEVVKKLKERFSEDPASFSELNKDKDVWKKFVSQYPAQSITRMSLDEYCMGRGSKKENFSWWIERGLQPVFGRYFPGNATAHILYRKPDGSLYKHRFLEGMNDNDALGYVLKVTQLLAQTPSLEQAEKYDDDRNIYKDLKIEPKVTMGEARKLRVYIAYHPDTVVDINSPKHIEHFLRLFGVKNIATGPFGKARQLWDVYQDVKKEIKDLTPDGFGKLLYDKKLGLAPTKEKNEDDETEESPVALDDEGVPRNSILYGPPGTGKTYSTIDKALRILDPVFYSENTSNRASLVARFRELKDQKRISFVTFHQSFSYEEFIEGLKAETDENGQITYSIEDGVFKQICDAASSKVTHRTDANIDLKGRTIWKVSLGNTQGEDSYIYDECVDNEYVLIGYGNELDFSGCKTKEDVLKLYTDNGFDLKMTDYPVTCLYTFQQVMKERDLVVVSDGNHKFRAIGEVTGKYRKLKRNDEDHYVQCRDVKWLRVYSPSRPREELMDKVFSQMTLYELKPKTLDPQRLAALLSEPVPGEGSSSDKDKMPYSNARVLIIDEINRGNIAKIFGELITLIENDKRSGQREALSVTLPYSKKTFSVPDNLYLIGTMNTADRSLTSIDSALRRRFVFEEVVPDSSLLADTESEDGIDVKKIMDAINSRIEILLGREYLIGHSYFLPLREDASIGNLRSLFKRHILPLLQEYFFDDGEKIHRILGDHQKPREYQIIRNRYGEKDVTALLGADWKGAIESCWEVNYAALTEPETYIGIYQSVR